MKLIKKVFTLLSIVFCPILLLNSCSNFKIVDKSNEYENGAIETLHNFIDEGIKKYKRKPLLDIKKIDIINVDFSNEKIKFDSPSSEDVVSYDGCYSITYKITSDFYDYGINVIAYPECNLEKKVKNLKSIHNVSVLYTYNEKNEMNFAPLSMSFRSDIYYEVYEQNKSTIGEWKI